MKQTDFLLSWSISMAAIYPSKIGFPALTGWPACNGLNLSPSFNLSIDPLYLRPEEFFEKFPRSHKRHQISTNVGRRRTQAQERRCDDL